MIKHNNYVQTLRLNKTITKQPTITVPTIIPTVQPTKPTIPPNNYKHYFGISATFRNERPYLKEWIDHYIRIGATIIILYDDRSSDNPLAVLQPYIDRKIVIYHKAQNFVYTYYNVMEVVRNYKYMCKWMAFIDIDEFLYNTKPTEKLIHILEDYDRSNIRAIHVNWLCFGSNNSNRYLNIPSTSRYTRRCDKLFGLNSEVKSIIQPSIIKNVTSSHIFELQPPNIYYNDNKEPNKLGMNNIILENLETNIKPYFASYGVKVTPQNVANKMSDKQYPPSYARLCINHYITRSKDEYKEKAIRYDSKRPDRYGETAFNNLNKHLNKVEDDHIHRILSFYNNI